MGSSSVDVENVILPLEWNDLIGPCAWIERQGRVESFEIQKVYWVFQRNSKHEVDIDLDVPTDCVRSVQIISVEGLSSSASIARRRGFRRELKLARVKITDTICGRSAHRKKMCASTITLTRFAPG